MEKWLCAVRPVLIYSQTRLPLFESANWQTGLYNIHYYFNILVIFRPNISLVPLSARSTILLVILIPSAFHRQAPLCYRTFP